VQVEDADSDDDGVPELAEGEEGENGGDEVCMLEFCMYSIHTYTCTGCRRRGSSAEPRGEEEPQSHAKARHATSARHR
jgi:hypothetical protein